MYVWELPGGGGEGGGGGVAALTLSTVLGFLDSSSSNSFIWVSSLWHFCDNLALFSSDFDW